MHFPFYSNALAKNCF